MQAAGPRGPRLRGRGASAGFPWREGRAGCGRRRRRPRKGAAGASATAPVGVSRPSAALGRPPDRAWRRAQKIETGDVPRHVQSGRDGLQHTRRRSAARRPGLTTGEVSAAQRTAIAAGVRVVHLAQRRSATRDRRIQPGGLLLIDRSGPPQRRVPDHSGAGRCVEFRACTRSSSPTKNYDSLQNALHSYLDDFGHEEADLLREVKALIAKLSRE